MVRGSKTEKDYGSWIDSKWSWNIPLRRPLFDWEIDQWKVFTDILEAIIIRHSTPNVLAWSFYVNGRFSVGSFHHQLADSIKNSEVDFMFS
ncbi:hypothetical protein Dsin_022739 [Dipteronia sinensis]|uniref:Uncharacterized protein n=1 Tax=Dipteronia sinensis TaxID=43782 RepID=A0AAE0A274_9ROSI|nr:hypothetical protein Dsin_022739 [Dipteronia sinensis]